MSDPAADQQPETAAQQAGEAAVLPELEQAAEVEANPAAADNLARVAKVNVTLSVEMGRRELTIGEAMQLTPGTIVELDRQADQPLDLLINGRPVARGEVVVVDNQFAVRITEILPADPNLPEAAD